MAKINLKIMHVTFLCILRSYWIKASHRNKKVPKCEKTSTTKVVQARAGDSLQNKGSLHF